VLGASGATGRHVVSCALERGHEVVAFVRQPGAFEPMDGLTEAFWPDVTDSATLTGSLHRVDVVISTLGASDKRPTTVCRDGVAAAVAAMTIAGVRRLIVLSAHGVLETHDKSLYVLATWAGVSEKMRDKEAMEKIVVASDLDWTIARPPMLSNRVATGTYRSGTELPIRLWSSISRADLAAFLVDEAETAHYRHAYPRVIA
jgi:putative NADH-flavin reductase